jgi:hypothetical protein
MSDRRATAVEHLSMLLEQDVIEIDVYKRLVDRILEATSDDELGAALAAIPEEPPLTLRCVNGVIRESPGHVPAMTAITCDSGVMRVDLSRATFSPDVDLDIECEDGVLSVVLPRTIAVEVGGRSGEGGVSLYRLRSADQPVARVNVYLHNGKGVVRLSQPGRHTRAMPWNVRFWRRAP